MKKLFLILTLLVGAISTHAVEATVIDTMSDAVYMQTTTVQNGTTANLYLRLKTSIDSNAFSTDITLPEGITVVGTRNCAGNNLVTAGDYVASGAYRVLFMDGTFCGDFIPAGSDVETVCVAVNVAESVAPGEYEVSFTRTEISSLTGAAGTMKRPGAITCVLKVQEEPVYDEGYALTIPALLATSGVEYDEAASHTTWLTLSTTNVAPMAKVSFNVIMPEGVTVGTYVVRKNEYPDSYFAWDNAFEGNDALDCTDNENGSYTIEAEYDIPSGTRPWIVLPLVTETSLPAGIHNVALTDVVFTAANGREYRAEDAIASIIVDADKVQILDLRLAYGVSNLTIPEATDYKNRLIYANEGQTTNVDNTIVDGTCANLILTDGADFNAPESFYATNASYSRNISNDWGTICLPYDVSSDSKVQYYTLASADVNTNELLVTPATSVAANQPALFKRLDTEASAVDISATNVDVAATDALTDELSSVPDWSMKGVFVKQVIEDAEVDGRIYYIYNDQFWRTLADGNVTVNPFRAYFVSPNAVNNAKFTIVEGEESGIVSIVASDGDVEIYDIMGRRISQSIHGIFIHNGHKFIVK